MLCPNNLEDKNNEQNAIIINVVTVDTAAPIEPYKFIKIKFKTKLITNENT